MLAAVVGLVDLAGLAIGVDLAGQVVMRRVIVP